MGMVPAGGYCVYVGGQKILQIFAAGLSFSGRRRAFAPRLRRRAFAPRLRRRDGSTEKDGAGSSGGTIVRPIGGEFNASLERPGGQHGGNFQPRSRADIAHIYYLPKKAACRVAAPVYENKSWLKMRQAEREASDEDS
jgi:hypothetical protein